MSEDKGGWIAFLIAAIVVAACVLALCGCDRASAEAMPDERTTEHAPGMPLDAVAYDPPAWMPNCYKAYRIYDRTNGEQWWVLVMGNGYVVLPLSEADR